jgi:DNA-binding CsgD family transcriptional regulator
MKMKDKLWLTQLAKEIGVNKYTLSTYVNKNDISYRSLNSEERGIVLHFKSLNKTSAKSLSNYDKDYINEFAKERTVSELAEDLNKTYRTIYYYIKRNNIKVKSIDTDKEIELNEKKELNKLKKEIKKLKENSEYDAHTKQCLRDTIYEKNEEINKLENEINIYKKGIKAFNEKNKATHFYTKSNGDVIGITDAQYKQITDFIKCIDKVLYYNDKYKKLDKNIIYYIFEDNGFKNLIDNINYFYKE